jgi:hypothetical protein
MSKQIVSWLCDPDKSSPAWKTGRMVNPDGERRAGGRPAAGGGRRVEVPPERLARWIAGFAERHGATSHTVDGGVLRLRAFDMAEAECHPPPGTRRADDLDDFVAAALAPHRVGLILARRSAVAVGIAEGTMLTSSEVAAGGAADIVNRLIVPHLPGLAAVVAGGDRRAVASVLSDHRLATVAARLSERFLGGHGVLLPAIEAARAIRIRVLDP